MLVKHSLRCCFDETFWGVCVLVSWLWLNEGARSNLFVDDRKHSFCGLRSWDRRSWFHLPGNSLLSNPGIPLSNLRSGIRNVDTRTRGQGVMYHIWIWLGAHEKETLVGGGVVWRGVVWWVIQSLLCVGEWSVRALWLSVFGLLPLHFVIECKAWPLLAIFAKRKCIWSLYSSSYIKIFKFFNLKRAIAQSAGCHRYKYIYIFLYFICI